MTKEYSSYGPGKYDDLCTQVREEAEAQGAIVVIFKGNQGSGISVQATIDIQIELPNILEKLAHDIRNITYQSGITGKEGNA